MEFHQPLIYWGYFSWIKLTKSPPSSRIIFNDFPSEKAVRVCSMHQLNSSSVSPFQAKTETPVAAILDSPVITKDGVSTELNLRRSSVILGGKNVLMFISRVQFMRTSRYSRKMTRSPLRRARPTSQSGQQPESSWKVWAHGIHLRNDDIHGKVTSNTCTGKRFRSCVLCQRWIYRSMQYDRELPPSCAGTWDQAFRSFTCHGSNQTSQEKAAGDRAHLSNFDFLAAKGSEGEVWKNGLHVMKNLWKYKPTSNFEIHYDAQRWMMGDLEWSTIDRYLRPQELLSLTFDM